MSVQTMARRITQKNILSNYELLGISLSNSLSLESEPYFSLSLQRLQSTKFNNKRKLSTQKDRFKIRNNCKTSTTHGFMDRERFIK